MIFLLLYVASYVPYSICYVDKSPDEPYNFEDYFDLWVDLMFAVDIVINFLSAYDDPKTGLPVISLRKIS